MENVQVALNLSLIAQRNIVIPTNDVKICTEEVKSVISQDFGLQDVIEIDLLHCQDDLYNQVTRKMVKLEEGTFPTLHEVVIWKNLEFLDMSLDLKSSIIQIFDELEEYNTVALKKKAAGEPFDFGEYKVQKPSMHLVIPIMDASRRLPQTYQTIKNRFWFAQSCYISSNLRASHAHETLDILESRQLLQSVYVKPSIQEYVCSLLVFTRSHRLCSLSPLTTRPPFAALEGIMVLAKCLTLWTNRTQETALFVIPDNVKVAYRKIGYWLVDWETNSLFNETTFEANYQKKMEISILTGDWYGSEWSLVENYLEGYRSKLDWSTSSGYSNAVVDEVLRQVLPPI